MEQHITAKGLAEHTSVLASPEFEGRLPASQGEERTLRYLTTAFAQLGCSPAGDKQGEGDAAWLQEVPLIEITPSGHSPLVLKAQSSTLEKEAAEESFAYLSEFVSFTTLDGHVGVEDAEVVFVGYGVVAPEYGWNDYEGIDVRGKAVVCLVNDPGFLHNDPKLFDGKKMTYYGRWTYKYEEAARQGASACFIVHWSTPAAGYGWNIPQHSKSGPHFHFAATDAADCAVKGWVTLDTARRIFARGGRDIDDEIKRASDKEARFRAYSLQQSLTVSLDSSIRKLTSHNVLALLEGSSRKDEVVVYSGHWDHFGKRADGIYHGARDNALSVAALLELAKAFASVPQEQRGRSVLFLAPTAEEQGLLGLKAATLTNKTLTLQGSEWYAEHTIRFPIEKTVACINMDLLNIFGRTKDVTFFGSGKSELDDYSAWAAEKQGRTVGADPWPENGMFYRSDHFSFAKRGVPGLFIYQGMDHVTRGKEYLLKMNERWTLECYHKPADQYVDDPASEWCWDLSGAEEDVRLLFLVGHRLLNEDSFPQWRPGGEFKRRG